MLVGRQAEQQAIDRLAAAARLGTSGVLALTGEAGVGKTALLEDAVARLSEMRVLRATGLESEREIPFGMLLQLAAPGARRARRDPAGAGGCAVGGARASPRLRRRPTRATGSRSGRRC